MSRNRSRLTVGDRILLLLINYTRFRGELQAPHDVTQDGIAGNLGIIRSAVPRAVGSLMSKGLVEEHLAHISGLTRRRKVYMLTDEGIMRSRELHDELSSIKIDVIDGDSKEKVKIGDLMESGDVDLTNISDVISSGELDKNREKEEEPVEKKGRTSYIHSLNPPKIFLGREREIDELISAIRSPKKKITMIYGIAGVGKTTLSWKITELLKNEMNIFYIDLKEWTSISYVLKEMASFFSKSGWEGLRSYLDSNKEPDIETVADLMKTIPEHIPILLILDDLQRAPEEIRMFLTSLKERIQQMKKLDMIVLSRERAGFYDIRDVKITNLIGEMELLGFDRETSKKLLMERGFEKNEVDKIVDRTGGHPLALVLVEKEGYNYDIGDFDQFLKEEIFNKLDHGSAKFLGLLSLSRLQLSEEDLRSIMKLDKEMMISLMDQHLMFSTPGGFVIHDLIKDQAIRTLRKDERRECHSLLSDLFRMKLDRIGFHQEDIGMVPPYPFGVEDESGLGPVPLYVAEEIFHLIGAERGKEALPVMIEAMVQIPSKDLVEDHAEDLFEQLKDLTTVEKMQRDLIDAGYQYLEGEFERSLKIIEYIEAVEFEGDDEMAKTIIDCARLWKPFIEERVVGPEKALASIENIEEEAIPERLRYYFMVTRASLKYKMGDHKGASEEYRNFLDTIIKSEDLPIQLKDSLSEALDKAEKGSIQVATDSFQKIMDLTGSNKDTLREELPYVDVDHHLLSAIYSLYHGRK